MDAYKKTGWDGSTLFETIAAVAISAMMVTAALQSIAAVWQQSRRTERRWIATCEAGNLIEELATRPWNDLTSESVATMELSDECQQSLPGAELTVNVISPEAEQHLKYVQVDIDWLEGTEVRTSPVRLVAARYRKGRQQAEHTAAPIIEVTR